MSQIFSPTLTEDELEFLKQLPREPLLTKPSAEDVATLNLLKHAESEVFRLFRKQEYFRKAYNDTLDRMNSLANVLPSYALDSIKTPLHPEDETNYEEDESDISLDPEYVNFMMKTLHHRRTRDNVAVNSQALKKMLQPPPKTEKTDDMDSIAAQIQMCETSLLHHAIFLSPCVDSPVWPDLPLNSDL
ncbi:unnamed protein product [Trichobilharzia regenti]|nr:unnamed protein product [Trichobilharzia regenti]